MTRPIVSDRFTTHQHRSIYFLGYLVIFGVALRRIARLDDAFSIGVALTLLAIFVLLYASQSRLSRRFKRYPRAYFALQMIIVQLLGLFRDYLDTWAALNIVLGLQLAACCSRKEALAWGSLFVASTLATLSFEFGVLSGMGRSAAYIILGIFLVSFDIQYAQREDAQAESQVLLEELQAAHQKLKEQAVLAEQLAAVEERIRITQEIHDSVGQKIFAIQLMAETISVSLEKDHGRLTEQLDQLQEQTQAALSQMRQLIARWRPGSPASPSKVGDPAAGLPLPSDA